MKSSVQSKMNSFQQISSRSKDLPQYPSHKHSDRQKISTADYLTTKSNMQSPSSKIVQNSNSMHQKLISNNQQQQKIVMKEKPIQNQEITYQHFLDIDLDNDSQIPKSNHLIKTRIQHLNLESDCQEGLNEDEIAEIHNDHRKPNTVQGIKDGGASIRVQNNNHTVKSKHLQNFLTSGIKSPQALFNRDHFIQSPLAISNNQGFKTPTQDIIAIDLNIPIKSTMKNNYQSVLAPVIELKQNSNLKKSGPKSRNDELKKSLSQTKSHQTTSSYIKGQGQNSIGDLQDNSIYSKGSQQVNQVSMNNTQTKNMKIQIYPQSPCSNLNTNLNLMFPGKATNMSKKVQKKTKNINSNSISNKNNSHINQQNSQHNSINLKNPQPIPSAAISLREQKQSFNPGVNNYEQVPQAYSSIVSTAKSAQGFTNTQQLYESKYNTTGGNTIKLKQELNSLLSQPNQSNSPHCNSKSTRQTPKGSFTQVINITQNQQNTINQKTHDILMQNLQEKTIEIDQLKRENRTLQQTLLQTEKELIICQNYAMQQSQNIAKFTPSATSDFMLRFQGREIEEFLQKKHIKTLSLKEDHMNGIISPLHSISTKHQFNQKLDSRMQAIDKACLTPNEKESKLIVIPRKKLSIHEIPSQNHSKEKQAFLCRLQDQTNLMKKKKKSMEILSARGSNPQINNSQDINHHLMMTPLSQNNEQKSLNHQLMQTWNHSLAKSTYEGQQSPRYSNDAALEFQFLQMRMMKILNGYKHREMKLVHRIKTLESLLMPQHQTSE